MQTPQEDKCPRPDKIRYLTKQEAQSFRKKKFGARITTRIYLCECGFYHLAHK